MHEQAAGVRRDELAAVVGEAAVWRERALAEGRAVVRSGLAARDLRVDLPGIGVHPLRERRDRHVDLHLRRMAAVAVVRVGDASGPGQHRAQKRVPKDSFDWYKKLIASNGKLLSGKTAVPMDKVTP